MSYVWKRREDKSIDLIAEFSDQCPQQAPKFGDGVSFLVAVESMHRINSRQAAAIAVQTAIHIACQP